MAACSTWAPPNEWPMNTGLTAASYRPAASAPARASWAKLTKE